MSSRLPTTTSPIKHNWAPFEVDKNRITYAPAVMSASKPYLRDSYRPKARSYEICGLPFLPNQQGL